VSDASPSRDEPAGTLYDPPDGAEEASVADEDSLGLRLRLSEAQAERLQAVAQQLGLTPSMVAQRAIKMVCDEVVTIQEDDRSPALMVDQYQARIDLLHAVEDHAAAGSTLVDGRDESSNPAARSE
jgi:predicted transcriptional regulator